MLLVGQPNPVHKAAVVYLAMGSSLLIFRQMELYPRPQFRGPCPDPSSAPPPLTKESPSLVEHAHSEPGLFPCFHTALQAARPPECSAQMTPRSFPEPLQSSSLYPSPEMRVFTLLDPKGGLKGLLQKMWMVLVCSDLTRIERGICGRLEKRSQELDFTP